MVTCGCLKVDAGVLALRNSVFGSLVHVWFKNWNKDVGAGRETV